VLSSEKFLSKKPQKPLLNWKRDVGAVPEIFCNLMEICNLAVTSHASNLLDLSQNVADA